MGELPSGTCNAGTLDRRYEAFDGSTLLDYDARAELHPSDQNGLGSVVHKVRNWLYALVRNQFECQAQLPG